MKVLTKSMEAIGFVLILIGGAGMDNTSIIVPVFMAVGGLALFAAGGRIEDAFNC